MHVYIYDNYVNQKKYDKIMAKVETRITDLGLNGKIIRIGMMNSAEEAIKNEMRKGAKTIVAVGNNSVFHSALNAMARLDSKNNLGKPVPLGFIPIDNKYNEISGLLGVGYDEEACDVLSARRIVALDTGIAGERHFLAQALIQAEGTTVEIDNNYSIEIMQAGMIGVANLPFEDILPEGAASSAMDGSLELCIINKKSSRFLPKTGKQAQSVFSFRQISIKNEKTPIILDGVVSLKTPVIIRASRNKIGIIVGKSRAFD